MLKRISRLAGVDRAVFFSLLNKGVVISFSIVTLGLVVTYFPPTQQGYYYTFTSLLVLQTFLELGMGTVLVQFVSHEWSKLHFDKFGHLDGDKVAQTRVASLVKMGLQWYLSASAAFFLAVGLIGSALLSRHEIPRGVLLPWWLLCAGVSISIMQVPLRSILEGSNQIARVQKIATAVFMCSSIAGWLAIVCGLQLYALAITAWSTAMLALVLFGRACLPFLRVVQLNTGDSGLSWKHEFWPQQWRIAVSWMSGFFMFQSFVPILFYFQGPVVAGRMGASLQIYNAVNAIASSWINAKGPQMGMLGAMGKKADLQALIHRTLTYSRLAALGCVALVLIVFSIMHSINYKADRFIDLGSLSVLLAVVVLIQQSNIETLAVRFQKIEPFVINSMVSAVLVFISNIAMSKHYEVFAVCAGFALIMLLITIPWCHRIYTSRLGSVVAAR